MARGLLVESGMKTKFSLTACFVFLQIVNAAGAGNPKISIGVEYVLVDRSARISKVADMLQPIQATAAKIYVEHMEWSAMQKGPDQPIDFSRVDQFVRDYQQRGFREIVLCFKSRSPWASKLYFFWSQGNPTPKPQYMDHYERWVTAVVERYDRDGNNDMPNLLFPVRYYEVGSEFSSYEPETPEEYLGTLAAAHRAAHRAYPAVRIAHAAFLTTNAFRNNPGPGEYESAFANPARWVKEHTLADIRKILDRPAVFDLLNVHALGDPTEIEGITRWLKYETGRRGYSKPMIISDTMTSPFIAWGPATVCNQDPKEMGDIIWPATEKDRCRLAAYFTKLVQGGKQTLEWTQGFAGIDNVKKIVIAAEQGYELIDTNFIEDLFWLKLPIVKAGAGNCAWAGLIDPDRNEKRAGFYALQQIVRFLKNAESIRRLPLQNTAARVYEVSEQGKKRWIAWFDPPRLVLPGDPETVATVSFQTGAPLVTVEETITRAAQAEPVTRILYAKNNMVRLTVNSSPLFIWQ
jgi:hypothetical protein